MGKNKVSVIVPIYKVEKFIERCVRSLMLQTLQEVEYIFVDDATPDKSMEVLKKCLALYSDKNVIILQHQQNQGLPAARNTGLVVATGEYIFHCDSDDYVEPTMLEKLYYAVKQEEADIVWCDWFLTFAENERYMKQPSFDTPLEALKAMLGGGMKYNVWNKLVRRSLYTNNAILFPSGYGMGEDMTMMMLFAHAKKVVYVPQAFYHYVKLNTESFSQTYSERHLMELKYNIQRISDYMQVVLGNSVEQELAFFKLEAKFPFLISNNSEKYKLWKEWYPEVNCYILQNKNVSFRSRCLQWLAWKGQYWTVKLHYYLLYKVIYGIIYK